MVVQNGKALYDFGDTKHLNFIASCRKSILSILPRPFAENGTIAPTKPLANREFATMKSFWKERKERRSSVC
jgi:hypothetical protein